MYDIWRIEGPDGRGPYRSTELPTIQTSIPGMHNDNEHPSTWEDYDHDYDHLFCAFTHPSDLRRWFWGLNRILVLVGYNVVKLTVKEIIRGKSGKQCFFKKEDIISKTIIK